MATSQHLDRRFLTFQEYIDRRGRYGLSDDDTPPYAHPVDGWILRTLNSVPVKMALDKALDTVISLQLGQYLANGIFIDERSFPDLFEVLYHCSETLGIPVPHAVANDSPFLFNAFTAGTDDYSFINITAGLCEHFTRDEAAFVIGHECGHIASQHMIYHTLVWVLQDAALLRMGNLARLLSATALPLMAWSRRSEVTADRAGLLCCGDIKVGERALVRLIAGHASADNVDIDDYLRRYREMADFHGASKWQESMSSHPFIPKRIEALRLFARSELYYDVAGKPRPAGVELLSRSELDRRVNHIVRP